MKKEYPGGIRMVGIRRGVFSKHMYFFLELNSDINSDMNSENSTDFMSGFVYLEDTFQRWIQRSPSHVCPNSSKWHFLAFGRLFCLNDPAMQNHNCLFSGYGRIVLAIISFYYMPTDYVTASFCYILSGFLDALDGHAARMLNQSEWSPTMLPPPPPKGYTMPHSQGPPLPDPHIILLHAHQQHPISQPTNKPVLRAFATNRKNEKCSPQSESNETLHVD